MEAEERRKGPETLVSGMFASGRFRGRGAAFLKDWLERGLGEGGASWLSSQGVPTKGLLGEEAEGWQ